MMTKFLLRSEYHSFSSVYGPPARGNSKKNDMETFVDSSEFSGLFSVKLGLYLLISKFYLFLCYNRKTKSQGDNR
jgi:hypothetical protein